MKNFLLSLAAVASLLIGSSVAQAHDPYCRPRPNQGFQYGAHHGVPPAFGLYGPGIAVQYGVGRGASPYHVAPNYYRSYGHGHAGPHQHHHHHAAPQVRAYRGW